MSEPSDAEWEAVTQSILARAPDRIWTYVTVLTPMEWPAMMRGYVSHKADLSDLGEPYLSAVKEALKVREGIHGK